MASSSTDSPGLEPYPELHFSDSDSDREGGNFPFTGDYSSRMEEIMDGEEEEEEEEEGSTSFRLDSEDEEEEGFFYTGVDSTATAASNYRDRLREVLGQSELTDEDEGDDVLTAGSVPKVVIGEEDHVVPEPLLNRPTSAASFDSASFSPRVLTPTLRKASSRVAKSFLDPSVSRLRSHTQRPSSSSSNLETTLSSSLIGFRSPSLPQNIDSATNTLSRISSFSNLNSHSQSHSNQPNSAQAQNHSELVEAVIQSIKNDVFRWTNLNTITKEVYAPASSAVRKAMSVLGAQRFETPTVLAANGYICLGTSDGKILVYDFRQNLKCVCGEDSPENHVGAVTALALSHDHTCVAAGYSTGYIQIYNLAKPALPIRSVPPTSLSLVYSGRKEGHIRGSRIISIGFVAGRHTAIVSADVHGLAFYHALGKVLFVEASDVLRILGRYPDPQPPPNPHKRDPRTHTVKQRNPRYTILMMAPLPLGTVPHLTDNYNLVALLTPTKLVVVGMKPNPKTWFKVTRGLEEGGEWRSQIRWKGNVAWFPCVPQPTDINESENENPTAGRSAGGKAKAKEENVMGPSMAPTLAFSWGSRLRIIRIEEVRVKQILKNPKTGKEKEVEVGAISYQDVVSWTSQEDILAIQWLNAQQLVVLTPNQIGVYDLQASKLIEQVEFDASTLMTPTLGLTTNGNATYQDSVRDISHSIRVYKGKIFLLGRMEIRVGTLLTWADRILSLVEDGDFLSAIELARSYYLDEVPGNRNGLPTDSQLRKQVIGNKLQELMVASARYAFSEDRMTDSTHITPDGRGVDRTALFESLVTTCCHACIAFNDTEFLFEELFQKYDDSGISAIYLRHMEPFVLNNEIHDVPPRIAQRLIGLHEQEGRPDLVERVIWHIDPACLDINQAIHLCQKHHLYDALIYVYTRALRDYVAPIVDLLGIIRHVLIHRRAQAANAGDETDEDDPNSESSVESMIVNSHKVYPYLSHVLTGLTYPSGEPLPDHEAFQAKKDIYTFLFYGRSSVWPPGEGGKLILTSDGEGGNEPTYPYIRQLLQWDAESFLHSLDIAFEDTFFNDESQSINRLIIIRILTELVMSASLSQEDATFVFVFIARNVSKYSHSLEVAPSLLHKTLENLAVVGKPETREDRQLAAEYLLSTYNPHDSEDIVKLFESAGFYRILQTWHRRDQRWDLLFMAYLDDPDIDAPSTFENIGEVLTTARRMNKGVLPPHLANTMKDTLGRLLQIGIPETALLLQKNLPHLHEFALDSLGDETADSKRFVYLQTLLSLYEASDIDESKVNSPPTFSPNLRRMFIDLQCRFHPQETVAILESLPLNFLQWDEIGQICETNQVHDAVIWAYDAQGDPRVALDKAMDYQRNLALQAVESLKESTGDSGPRIEQVLASLRAIGKQGVDICVRRSRLPSGDVPLEDIWFKLLNSQINVLQLVSSCTPSNSAPDEGSKSEYLSELRSLVQNTFGALVSIASTSVVSFPRLFKRLANSTSSTAHSHYNEFRTILTGMLESYRSDGDMLTITKHLVERDLFYTMADFTRQKSRGWTLERGVCLGCRLPLSKKPREQDQDAANEVDVSFFQIVVARTGKAYHSHCYID